ncbi:MAG: AraC family transcriptional regulator [Pseudomonadota bacterium]
MSHDVLSEVLRNVRLRGAAYYHVNGGQDWVAEAHAAREVAAIVLPGSEHVLEYHVVTHGSCWGGIIGEPPVHLQTGDILMFPHGDAHVMSSAPGMRAPTGGPGAVERSPDQLPFNLRLSGVQGTGELSDEAVCTTLICGFLGCDVRPFNPLIAALPRLLHLRSSGQSGWIVQLMQNAVSESLAKRPGGEAMLERLSEMMFVDAMRRYADTLPEGSSGWFAGLRDRLLGRALAFMHDDPAADWSVDELGRRVGLSRSALHQRFVDTIGLAPMQYLASWRMQLAASLLRNTSATIAAVAQEVGYASEAAFSRAFRRLLGMPPSAWRRASMGNGHGAITTPA